MSWQTFIKPDSRRIAVLLILIAFSIAVTFPLNNEDLRASSLMQGSIGYLTLYTSEHCLKAIEGCRPPFGDTEIGVLESFPYGLGFPFMWFNVHLCPTYVVGCPNSNCLACGHLEEKMKNYSGAWSATTWVNANEISNEVITFDPINFILDIVILYAVALAMVGTYDKFIKKKNDYN